MRPAQKLHERHLHSLQCEVGMLFEHQLSHLCTSESSALNGEQGAPFTQKSQAWHLHALQCERCSYTLHHGSHLGSIVSPGRPVSPHLHIEHLQ